MRCCATVMATADPRKQYSEVVAKQSRKKDVEGLAMMMKAAPYR